MASVLGTAAALITASPAAAAGLAPSATSPSGCSSNVIHVGPGPDQAAAGCFRGPGSIRVNVECDPGFWSRNYVRYGRWVPAATQQSVASCADDDDVAVASGFGTLSG